MEFLRWAGLATLGMVGIGSAGMLLVALASGSLSMVVLYGVVTAVAYSVFQHLRDNNHL